TRFSRDWSSDVCSSDLQVEVAVAADAGLGVGLGGALLEAADEQHLPVVVEEHLGLLVGEGRVALAAPSAAARAPGGAAALRLGRVSHAGAFLRAGSVPGRAESALRVRCPWPAGGRGPGRSAGGRAQRLGARWLV